MTDFIEVIDDALPAKTCQQLIHQFEQSPGRYQGRTSGGVDTEKKNSEDVMITRAEDFKGLLPQVIPPTTAHLMNYIEKYYFALIGPMGLTLKHPETGEPVKVTQDNFHEVAKPNLPHLIQYLFRLGDINAQKYQQNRGGYPYWHSEVYPQAGGNDALHRMLLFMYYLNDVEEGGETEFYYQQRAIKPKQGRMVIAPGYFTHTHRGNMPISNDKYIITSWMLFNPAEKIYR
ncbi:hypothetical protein HMF8227_00265 [Saliniradius amylolyticus]|uniref:Prolyl 4-hydroxylase alpha subunit domain-containing protein n=1 Tax=Saliniradius amylolyticus TaxID=2183582 RepID=A0A2S2DZJ0_9ALTE|nr:2OG-Fe(II) oxygenase [Saliniradius amylolyticus]AWL10773.1 hypothetical protein HMF8227_00265 [Saliniradius amylolyticus]